jgi:hypothetical protein
VYRWSFEACAASGLVVHHSTKSWTLLSSPKCHKVGRVQLAHRESCYSVSFDLVSGVDGLGLGGACALGRMLLHLNAAFGHGLLQLRESVLRVPCQLHVFEAFMCLPCCWRQCCWRT